MNEALQRAREVAVLGLAFAWVQITNVLEEIPGFIEATALLAYGMEESKDEL